MVDTRERIIVATNELFRRFGYNGTSLKQISIASEAPIGSIYHFFPGGKEEIGVAVIETTGMAYRELFEMIAASSADPASAYVDFFNGGADLLEGTDFIEPCPIGSVAREVANTSEPLRIAASKAFDSWIDAANTHLVGAGIAPERAAALAEVFVATVEGMLTLSRTQRSTISLRASGRTLGDLVNQAIAASVKTS